MTQPPPAVIDQAGGLQVNRLSTPAVGKLKPLRAPPLNAPPPLLLHKLVTQRSRREATNKHIQHLLDAESVGACIEDQTASGGDGIPDVVQRETGAICKTVNRET